jgi:hypothetical protein
MRRRSPAQTYRTNSTYLQGFTSQVTIISTGATVLRKAGFAEQLYVLHTCKFVKGTCVSPLFKKWDDSFKFKIFHAIFLMFPLSLPISLLSLCYVFGLTFLTVFIPSLLIHDPYMLFLILSIIRVWICLQ